MPRPIPWPAAAVGLGLAILALVGCTSGSKPGAPNTAAVPASAEAPPKSAPTKLFADWPKPAGALVITGQQLGYLEPCGCTRGQKGGLIRRQSLIEQLRKQGWDLALVDLGALINEPTQHGGPLETNIRYATALKALQALGYDAVALSAQDLKLTVQEVLGLYMNRPEEPKIVAANVTPDPVFGLESKFVPAVRTEAGPITIGVTAVLDPNELEEVRDPDKSVLLTTKPPQEVLPGVLADLEKDTNVQVLMVQGEPDVARNLAKAYPGFDVVVATTPVVDPDAEPEMLNGGKTMLVQVGKKGQYVGVVGLFQDPEHKFRYQRVWLTDRFDEPNLVKLGEPMRALLDDEFPAALKAANVLETYPRKRYTAFNAPADATYVGAETCKECHAGSYDRWARSRHAHAYEGLTQPGRNREYDAECVSCHVTGFEYVGGYVTPETTAFLKGNQCENCHGPGSRHAAEPDNKEYLAAIARDVVDWEENYRCMTCHDDDNDNDFKFGRDWSKIDHNGLDDYSDPKVHRGIEPKRVAGNVE